MKISILWNGISAINFRASQDKVEDKIEILMGLTPMTLYDDVFLACYLGEKPEVIIKALNVLVDQSKVKQLIEKRGTFYVLADSYNRFGSKDVPFVIFAEELLL